LEGIYLLSTPKLAAVPTGMAGTLQQQPQRHQQQMTNGVGNASSSKSSASFTNGNYRQSIDDKTYSSSSHGDQASNASRPTSQGVTSSSSGQSRPNTSGEQMSLTSTITASPSKDLVHQQRPGSAGTDIGGQPAMRHGFAEAYSSEEYLTMLEQVFQFF